MPASADLLRHEPFSVLDRKLTAHDGIVQRTLNLVGGEAVAHSDEEVRGLIASLELVGSLSALQLEALRDRTRRTPLFLWRSDETVAADGWLSALETLTGVRWRLQEPRSGNRWTFGEVPDLWPFTGVTLAEAGTRHLGGLEAESGQIERLVSREAGCVFIRWSNDERAVFVSLAPLPDDEQTRLLKHEFCGDRFLGLLPLLHFARVALGEAGWRTPTATASFIVDDPNLRVTRYGFLDYRRLLQLAREHGFHTAIALIPLDYRKTRPRAAALVRENGEYLSLVIHGIDHLKREFGTAVTPAAAAAKLGEGLARMRSHAAASGIDHANAMTFPHGACNETWLAAMRDAGLDAGIANRALPFAEEDVQDDPFYELYPAQMTFRSFPMVNRFKAEDPQEELLFQAWLGKPLIIYTHHGFFRDGMERALEIVDFVNRHVGPTWCGIEAILRANYQRCRRRDGTAVRVFSNHVSIQDSEGDSVGVVLKPGKDVPPDETASVNGEAIDSVLLAEGLGLAALPVDEAGLTVRFGPARRIATPARVRRPVLTSRLRRLATEARDQGQARLARSTI